MDLKKSLDELELIAALLRDLHRSHGAVFNSRALRNTYLKVASRTRREGLSFLTKTLPKLGKALDKALAEVQPLKAIELGFKPQPDSELPILMGEFFNRVLQPDGTVRPDSCITSVKVLRQFLYLFYKYELAYTTDQEQQVIDQFVKTESDLNALSNGFNNLEASVAATSGALKRYSSKEEVRFEQTEVARRARILLSQIFAGFDPKDIYPKHGPGAVSTRERLWEKYLWRNVSANITTEYPLDEYYFASLGHVCDAVKDIQSLDDKDLPARVILVPKDSRGPRLISCEPVDYQWIQQGLGGAIVQWVERHVPLHPVTGKPRIRTARYNVHFTDQGPNQRGALLGSSTGRYSTLDLKEASDRVSLDLVRLLWPDHLFKCLVACRSSATRLPNGEILPLKKFAPMGSCLCFPVMALTIWAILTAAASDAETRESLLVYGDDVVVPTAYAGEAIKQLESFGLKINPDKCCIKGFFRESCGTDAFKGIDVTPLKIRTVWSSHISPDVFTSWIAYANQLYDMQYFESYYYIVEHLHQIYGELYEGRSDDESVPALREVPLHMQPKTFRTNDLLQKREVLVWTVMAKKVNRQLPGWAMLLRYFTEAGRAAESAKQRPHARNWWDTQVEPEVPFRVRTYTYRKRSMLRKRWR